MPATLMPVEQYLRSSGEFEPDADFVDGEIELRPMGELGHTNWQTAILVWFLNHAKPWNVYVRQELRVQVSLTRFRIPDVVVWDRDEPVDRILTAPPIAVFEVLSPEDRMTRMIVKLADYEAMGIRAIRVIEPSDGTIFQFQNGRLNPIQSRIEQLPDGRCIIDWDKIEGLLDI